MATDAKCLLFVRLAPSGCRCGDISIFYFLWLGVTIYLDVMMPKPPGRKFLTPVDNPFCIACDSVIRADNNDSFISCSKCKKSFHRICTKLSATMCTEVQKLDSQLRWFCVICNGSIDDDLAKISSLSDKVIAMDVKYDEIKAELNEVKELLSDSSQTARVQTVSVEKSRANIEETKPKTDTNFLRSMWIEFENKKYREKNIVISGLDELVNPDPKICKAYDLSQAIEIIGCLDLTETVVAECVDVCFRLGQTEGRTKPRLLKVILNSVDVKNAIVKKARQLRDFGNEHPFSACYINPDRTKAELDAFHSIRLKRRERLQRGDEPKAAHLQFDTESADLMNMPPDRPKNEDRVGAISVQPSPMA